MEDHSSISLDPEGTGQPFSHEAMLLARQKSWEAIHAIAARIEPGMCEDDALAIAAQWLADAGMERFWHGSKIRFGSNTLKAFSKRSDPDVRLGDNDIFFIDLGPVWNGHEGDVGDTFVTGTDPDMLAAQQAVRKIFDLTRDVWQKEQLSGAALYERAEQFAQELGWVLDRGIPGHRVSDFPHALYKAGSLAHFSKTPASGLWVLEIQIRHPERPFGAFFEDLLLA